MNMNHNLGKLEIGEKMNFLKRDLSKIRDAVYYQEKTYGKRFSFLSGRYFAVVREPENTISDLLGVKLPKTIHPNFEPVSKPSLFDDDGLFGKQDKQCIDCGQWLPPSAFGKDTANVGGGGLRSVCKVCFKAREDKRKN